MGLFFLAYMQGRMTHILKEDDQSFILTIYVNGLWSLFFQIFGTLSTKYRSF